MKRLLSVMLAAVVCLPAPLATAWDKQNYIEENALPPETLYTLDGKTYVQGIDEAPYLYVLTEDGAGDRYLTIFQDSGGAYLQVAASAPLPEMNGSRPSIIANCILYYGEALIYGFHPDGDGVWRLTYVQGQTSYTCTKYWLIEQVVWHGRLLCGADTSAELAAFDPTKYPPGFDAVAETLDTDGYALVDNPNPNDRLHLRAAPDRTSDSKGKYYNGTPVRILKDLGEWAEVSVAGVGGYMMKKYLALGADMLNVQSAFPELFLKPSLAGQDVNVRLTPETDGGIAGVLTDLGAGRVQIVVIGIVGDDWVHVICGNGLAGYIPAADFYPGNG